MIRQRAGKWRAAVLGAALVAVAASASARPAKRSVTSTGLVSLTPDHAAVVNLADVGDVSGAEAPVVVEILDGTNSVLANLVGTLRPGEPLSLQLNRGDLGDFPDNVPIRARVTIGPFAGDLHPQPILTLELLNLQTLDTFQATVCPVPYGPDVALDVLFGSGPCHTKILK